MNTDMIIIFFGELSTKGKNIMNFIRLLGNNIKYALRDFKNLTYEIRKDHIIILLNGEDFSEVKKPLKKVSGIGSFALAKNVDKNMDAISEEAKEVYLLSKKTTFKVETRRADKDFPIHSDDVSRKVGSYILRSVETAKVDVHNPEVMIHIMIRLEGAYVYAIKEKGMGGYPLGIAGKSLCLLSGGIDSPVAAYLMMKRGVKLECIHFAAPPYTSQAVIDKIHDLLHVLNEYQPDIKLYVVPFTELERKIYEVAGPSYCVTVMRRMMMRIAERIANKHNDLILSSGESIGQVASQTLPSMKVIEECCHLPMVRPLACTDKSEIIQIAKDIGTYDISIRPFEDCCTIFTLKDPVTHPSLEVVNKIESEFDWQTMVSDCVKNTTAEHVTLEEEF
ncbi:MAG: tRNA uracil 4-sulfurtransferase ThiI [Candidatus Enterosoma sp.]|nr:tRNA 4-thiouridine(8) synthase ThiI [Bacilli bacterium]MDD7181677.1 tRNA 4-thiouridine(8) synthase ThiI [Bacilli bacterium]MDY3047269.1 tRNA uracil 4-sulfurtransferase ThiI [Candidatus Enterosoma sp.]